MTSIEDARLLFPGAAGCVYLENSARGLLPITARDAAGRVFASTYQLQGAATAMDAAMIGCAQLR